MTRPAGPGPASGQYGTERPARPFGVDVVAALLVFGGLFGATQLLFGDFVITGRLPARGPILGVAGILYAASISLGVAIRTGRAWLPALNLAGLFAVVYLAAFGHPVAMVLGAAHGTAVVLLFRARAWFGSMAGWRRSRLIATTPGPRSPGHPDSRSPRRGGSRRPSGRR